MSLEAAIAKLQESVEKNNELLEQVLSGRDEVLKKKAEKPAASKAKAAKETDSDDEEEAPAKKTRAKKKAPAKKAPAKKSSKSKKKAPGTADVRKAFGGFMSVEDEDEREERKAFVIDMLAHFDVKKATEIEEDDRQKAIDFVENESVFEGWQDATEKNKTFDFDSALSDEDGDDEDDDSDDLI